MLWRGLDKHEKIHGCFRYFKQYPGLPHKEVHMRLVEALGEGFVARCWEEARQQLDEAERAAGLVPAQQPQQQLGEEEESAPLKTAAGARAWLARHGAGGLGSLVLASEHDRAVFELFTAFLRAGAEHVWSVALREEFRRWLGEERGAAKETGAMVLVQCDRLLPALVRRIEALEKEDQESGTSTGDDGAAAASAYRGLRWEALCALLASKLSRKRLEDEAAAVGCPRCTLELLTSFLGGIQTWSGITAAALAIAPTDGLWQPGVRDDFASWQRMTAPSITKNLAQARAFGSFSPAPVPSSSSSSSAFITFARRRAAVALADAAASLPAPAAPAPTAPPPADLVVAWDAMPIGSQRAAL